MDWKGALLSKAKEIIRQGEGELVFSTHNEKGFIEWKIEGGKTVRSNKHLTK